MKTIQYKKLKSLTLASLTATLFITLATGCGSDDDNDSGGGAQQEQTVGPLGPGASQVERLARPAINEALIISNDFLNAFNQIPPSADLGPAAAPVVAEAATVIDAADGIDGKDDTTVAGVATAFLPDVMRIDTRVNAGPGKTAYNSDVSGDKGMLTGGRKIEDDVMDITLSFLVAGDATGKKVKDNVSYEGVAGNPSQPGHKRLNGQRAPKGRATFPFLARPY